MRIQHNGPAWQSTPPAWLRVAKSNLPILIFLLLSVSGMGAVYWFFSPAESSGAEALALESLEGSLSAPIFKSVPERPVLQRFAQSPGPLRLGIISGHKGSDSGSVCDDGLTEAEVNLNIADRVVSAMRARGIRTELLDEFDPRLDGYSATALISVHADSCSYINELATGFKIAGSSFTDSSKLSICIEQAYGEATALPYHENTITPHMTDYHAFRKIAPGTPAIIVETGFVNKDRELLTTNADLPVAGLVKGILCFLDSN